MLIWVTPSVAPLAGTWQQSATKHRVMNVIIFFKMIGGIIDSKGGGEAARCG